MPVSVGECSGRTVMPVSSPWVQLHRTGTPQLCVEKWVVVVEMLAGGALGRSAMMSLNRLN